MVLFLLQYTIYILHTNFSAESQNLMPYLLLLDTTIKHLTHYNIIKMTFQVTARLHFPICKIIGLE